MKTKYWYWIWRTFLGPSRLRRKFVKTFVIAGLVPLLLMGGASIYLVNLTHRIDVADIEHTLARQVTKEIEGWLENIKTGVKISYTFENVAPVLLEYQAPALQDLVRGNAAVEEISFVCTTAQFCAVGKETERLMQIPEKGYVRGPLRNLKDTPQFLKAAAGETYTSPALFGSTTPHLTLSSPVLNQQEKIIAVLTESIRLDYIQKEIVSKAILGETGYVYVIDGASRIIAHPDQTRVGRIVSHLPLVEPFAVSGGAPPKRFAKSSFYKNLDGTSVSGVTEGIPELNWRVIAEWPQAETQALIYTILVQIGAFSIFALIVLISIASWVALRLIQPIAKLREGTSIIGGGNFDYRVDIRTGDEIEDLGKNLNKMAENLKGLDEIKELRLRTDLLSESLKKEQELSKLKDQFITTVSHQFNTPLSVINWTLESFSEPRLTKKKIQEQTEIIGKSTKDIANIVSDLVTLSDIGFRYQKSKAKPINLAELIQKSVERFTSEAQIKKIQFTFVNAAPRAIIEANEFTLAKAIDNLIDNALSYTNEGGTVQVILGDDPKGLLLTVKDTGIGIPKADQPSIFQQFFRAKNAVQKKNVGTGLGLFIVKTIVEGHGGKVWFESKEGKGSTFYAAFPKEINLPLIAKKD
jgi:signal transduction histidine kinase